MPDLIRHPVLSWILASAGMTTCARTYGALYILRLSISVRVYVCFDHLGDSGKVDQANRVNKLEFKKTFHNLVESLKLEYGLDKAAKLSVGGDFEAIGLLELETLKYFGLKEDSYVIDVGCGAGRLTVPLSAFLRGKYLGIDIVPELVAYARRIAKRPDWRFEAAEGLSIPEGNEAADFVCFFSVFTHLLHEQSFVYLKDAKRVLKEGGKIIFSFLDFTLPEHWHIFESNIKDIGVDAQPLNMFMSKDLIRVWAEHLGLQVYAIEDGNRPYVPLSRPIIFENGSIVENLGTIGQSVAVLQKGLPSQTRR
jgi:SAM-dependent methyltransferase